jgi:hypothetical protein
MILKKLAKKQSPSNLTLAVAKKLAAYNKWLVETSEKFQKMANLWETAISQNATKQMNGFNIEYLSLQNRLQMESRFFHNTGEFSVPWILLQQLILCLSWSRIECKHVNHEA